MGFPEERFQIVLLPLLQALNLQRNNLSGPIHASVGGLKEPEDLALSYNELSGNIIGNCRRLHLGSSNCKKLMTLDLSFNDFKGGVPPEIGNYSSLQSLARENCNLTAKELQQLGDTLKLNNNQLQGKIPHALCKLKKLQSLELFRELALQGGTTQSLQWTLKVFNLGSNQLHEFPESHHSLSYVSLHSKNFEGPIPRSLGSCKNLLTIDPEEVGNLQNRGELYLSNSHLEGPLPSQLSGCVRILKFDVGSKSLNGSVPSSFRSWKSLSTLVLSDNQFSEAIPPFLAEHDRLSDLRIARNAFGGEIPSSVGLLKSLHYGLDLSGNGFTGEIPVTLVNLINLDRLNISNNKLTGSLLVPQRFRSLLQVDVLNNQLTWPIPEKLISDMSMFSGNPDLCIQASSSHLEDYPLAAGSSLFVFALLFALVLVFLRHKRGAKTEDAHVLNEEEGLSLLLNRVLAATENLDDKNIIGRGADGVVYRATLGPGEEYAVKKLIFAEHLRSCFTRAGDKKESSGQIFQEETDIMSWVRYVLSSYEDDDTAGPIVDPTLVDTKLREQAIQVTDLALRCTDKRPENRPSMRNVVKELTDVKELVRKTSVSVQ
ncbi:unnamed protein product [Arabis nemorensis]|uniref:Protein kinase domain-containing protein n=1 Tax=Arabis nemorensis TaxID=586526 RepID=A0A565B9W2_9BRAS|nr:unnamed protein product [Arabis nemorensis]